MVSLLTKSEGTRSKGLWKHSNSLCAKRKYINSVKNHIILFSKIESSTLETKLNILACKFHYRDDPEYVHCKEELDTLYEGKIEDAIIRSRCDWYEHGEKSSKFFIKLRKKLCSSKSNKFHPIQ